LYACGLLALAAFQAVPLVLMPEGAVIAIAYVGYAVTMYYSVTYFRKRSLKRIAPLDARRPVKSLPAGAFVIACLMIGATIAAAAYFRSPWGLIVASSSIVLVWMAWQFASTPALLFGCDIVVERIVDEHLRIVNATRLLAMSIAAGLIYSASVGGDDVFKPKSVVAFSVAVLPFLLVLLGSILPLTRTQLSGRLPKLPAPFPPRVEVQ
jgi:hypothetical protein